MRASGMVLMIGVLLALGGCPRSAPLPAAPSAQFLALGDSYTIGESVEESDRWPEQLVRRLRDEAHIDLGEPKIIAHTGWTTSDLSFAVDVENPAGPYKLVSLLIGVNNEFRHGSIPTFRKEFSDLLKRAVGFAGNDPTHVIVLSIPDWGQTPYAQNQDREQIGKDIDSFNAVCKDECKKQNVPFMDITPISRDAARDPSLVAPDGLHPSAKMYQRWVEQVLPAVRAALSKD